MSRRAWGAVLVAALIAGAPALSPRPPDLQEDVAGARYLPPLARAQALTIRPDRIRIVTDLRRVEDGWEFTRAGERGRVADSDLAAPPSPRRYLLGTDSLGRDLASRLLHGLRHSAAVAALSVVLALGLGIAAGTIAGLSGGWRDALLMRAVDLMMSVPRVLVYLVCATLFRPSAALLVLVLGATTWTGLARMVRARMAALRGSDLALAGRATGASPIAVAIRHLIPQAGPVIAVAAALRFADTILLESVLSFLGLAAPPPAVSLGAIVASGREALADAWWIALPPGIVIAILVILVRSWSSRFMAAAEPLSSA